MVNLKCALKLMRIVEAKNSELKNSKSAIFPKGTALYIWKMKMKNKTDKHGKLDNKFSNCYSLYVLIVRLSAI